MGFSISPLDRVRGCGRRWYMLQVSKPRVVVAPVIMGTVLKGSSRPGRDKPLPLDLAGTSHCHYYATTLPAYLRAEWGGTTSIVVAIACPCQVTAAKECVIPLFTQHVSICLRMWYAYRGRFEGFECLITQRFYGIGTSCRCHYYVLLMLLCMRKVYLRWSIQR